MPRLIDGDTKITALLYNDEHEETERVEMSIADFLDGHTEEGCPKAVCGWISVKDEMPELEGDYLVTDGYHVPWKCRLLKLAGVKGWANHALNPIVNYWMPMPEPPKEGDRDA